MTDRELAGCPFCGAAMQVVSNRDWHRIGGAHDDGCILEEWDMESMVPATDEDLEQLVAAWNRRTPSSEGDGRDAARYRWLRENAGEQIEMFQWLTIDTGHGIESVQGFLIGEQIDAAIDAAIAAAEGETK